MNRLLDESQSERSQFKKVTYCMIPFVTFWKTKLWGQKIDQWLPRVTGRTKSEYKGTV